MRSDSPVRTGLASAVVVILGSASLTPAFGDQDIKTHSDDTADTYNLLRDGRALREYLAEGHILESEAYGIFNMPASEDVAETMQMGNYEKYQRDDFMAVELFVSSTVALNGDGQVEITSTGRFRPSELDDVERTIRGLSEYPISVALDVSGEATEVWHPEFPTDGLLIADPEGGELFRHRSIGHALSEEIGVLRLLGGSGEPLGGITFTFFRAS